MKTSTSLPARTAVGLASLAAVSWLVGAHLIAADAPSAVANSPIHYSFDDSPLDRTNHTVLSSYADMLNQVTPSVVGIYPSRRIDAASTATGRRGRRGGGGIIPQADSTDQTWVGEDNATYRVMGAASGCILSPDGYIVTNHHVVADATMDRTGTVTSRQADGFLVKLSDGREFEARLIGSDQATDLALLKIDAKNLPTIKMADSQKIKVGDIVFAVGNPMDVGLTVTHGIVSATGRTQREDPSDPTSVATGVTFEDFIQTDAPINPGNSGGPLVDAQGRLIGLDAAIVSTAYSGGSIGIGFAIPSDLVRKVADDIIKVGHVRRGALGVESDDVIHSIAEAWKLPNVNGALVTSVDPATPGAPETPAAKAGIVHGDIITKVNEDDVDSRDKLRYLIALKDPGTPVNLTVWHNGETKVVKVVLGDRENIISGTDTSPTDIVTPASVTRPAIYNPNEALAGLSLLPYTNDLRQELRIPDDIQIKSGVAVIDVAPNSPYAMQLPMGTVIVEANQKPVANYDDLRTALKPGGINVLYVYSPVDGKFSFVAINLPGAN